jgi:deazaflavin-dependent oxidoreductase (nitroreductase family)
MTWLDDVADREVCDLTTTGRVTGRPHRIEIWFGVGDGKMYFIAGGGPSTDWYRNALAAPGVTVHFPDGDHGGRARDVTDPDERRRCGDVMGAKYPWDPADSVGITLDEWCYDVPALAVEFDDPAR